MNAAYNSMLILHNAEAADASAMPVLDFEAFAQGVIDGVEGGARIAALFGRPAEGDRIRLTAVLADDRQGCMLAGAADVADAYDSLTVDCPQAHWFEREIAEQWGVVPTGHPWLKPIRFHKSYRPGRDAWGRSADSQIAPCVLGEQAGPGVPDYFKIAGEQVHEVAVGPVHAGIIEPGHFRFQCHGENVYHLEISLGYQHRGVERAMLGCSSSRRIHYVETLAGDTTIGHTWAHCLGVEALAGVHVPPRAMALRGVALELERMANHIGDLGALAGDVGYLPTASYCGRIRGDVLNATAWLCGNRFGRGMVRPGGVGVDVDESLVQTLLERLEAIGRDTAVAVNLLWDTPSVTARFEETGAITAELARELGLVGVAARACGVEIDVRHDMPFGIYRFAHIPVSSWQTGDVFARAYVRWLEIQRSLAFIRDQLTSLPTGPIVAAGPAAARPNRIVASLTEGWRGEICHVAVTDAAGQFAAYKVVDPSFHNWFGLAYALRNQQVSDFPLCNKSFNLSYCGHDL